MNPDRAKFETLKKVRAALVVEAVAPALMPALRAGRVHPLAALRQE